MSFYKTETVVIRFFIGAIGTAAALWSLWDAHLRTPSARGDWMG